MSNKFFSQKNVRLQILISLAFASELLYIIIASLGNIRFHIPLFLLSYGAIFILYALACAVFFTGSPDPRRLSAVQQFVRRARTPFEWLNEFFERQTVKERLWSKEILTVGILFGLIFRVTLLFTTPSLSDDIYRYVWDGRVASEGINPYLHPPEAVELDSLRDTDIYPFINHKEISTIYPPVLQWVFAGLYQLKPTVQIFKVGFLLFDLLTMLVLAMILKALALSPNRVLLYVWNPLVILEVSGSGHSDIVGIFLLSVLCWFVVQRKLVLATLLLVLSFLTKFITIVLLPVVTFMRRESKLIIPIQFIILCGLFYLPFADAGKELFSGLSVYAAKWEYNGSIFPLLAAGIERLLKDEWIVRFMIEPKGMAATPETLVTRGNDMALLIAKIIIAVSYSGLGLYYLVRLKKDVEREGQLWFFRLGIILIGSFLLLAPTLHPWYLCWLLPFLVVVPNRAWLLLTGLVVLPYWILVEFATTGIWQEVQWIKYLEFLPFFALLAFDYVRSKLRTSSLEPRGNRLQSSP